VFSKQKRSEVMSRIRSRGNKATELALVKLFRTNKITGWRRHFQVRIAERGMRKGIKKHIAERGVRNKSKAKAAVPPLRTFAVRPDFVFIKSRTALFVDGCFWHGCPQHGTQPKGNAAFWRKKISGNQPRDRLVNRTLRSATKRQVSKKKIRVTSHPMPSPPAPLPSDGRRWRRTLPGRGVESAELRLSKRIRRALE
jgi:DNA mismatch endonuclease (patch repair protein)